MNRTIVLFPVFSVFFAALPACPHEIGTPERATLGDPTTDDAPLVPSPFFAGDPAANATFALDISFWEGPVSEDELECFWDSGVRHIVAGTQVEEITRQQLGLAVALGMTVDAYEYLYWDQDMATQVDEAMAITEGFPIGRLWLDVEENPGDLGSNALIALVDQAVQRCREYQATRGIECGIYTGPGFWRSYMSNTTRFADVALWYAWYNARTSLASWDVEHFGGWDAPTAKQWAEEVICGYGADKNTMIVREAPTVVVEHDPAPITATVPPAPERLWPADTVTQLEYIKLMSSVVPGATRYQFALERYTGTSWVTYFTWTGANAFRWVYPTANLRGFVYRFRARAQNARGYGEWSPTAQFDFGTVTGARPADSAPPASPPPASPPPASPPPASPPPASPPPAEPPVAGAPAALTPDAIPVSSSSVTLSCGAVSDATEYMFSIEYDVNGALHPYMSYQRAAPATTFWPQVSDTRYTWRVRAKVGGTWGPWSNDASFDRP